MSRKNEFGAGPVGQRLDYAGVSEWKTSLDGALEEVVILGAKSTFELVSSLTTTFII